MNDEAACLLSTSRSLASLELADNRITDLGALALSTVTQLQRLGLGNSQPLNLRELPDAGNRNNIGWLGAKALLGHEKLRSLNLIGNAFMSADMAGWPKLKHLQQLDLADTGDWAWEAVALAIDAIAACKSLTSLNLGGNQWGPLQPLALDVGRGMPITGAADDVMAHVIERLRELPQLADLNLAQDFRHIRHVSYQSLAGLAQLPALTSLDVTGYQWTAATVTQFAAAFKGKGLRDLVMNNAGIDQNHLQGLGGLWAGNAGAVVLAKHLPQLKKLALRGHNLTDHNVRAFLPTSLIYLDARDNQSVTSAVVDAGLARPAGALEIDIRT